VIDAQGCLLSDARRLLVVPTGERGLRQSEGVFSHVQNLPALAEAVAKEIGPLRLRAVAASSRPRPVAGSYMPVFTVGTGFGRALAASFGVPFLELSHQEGHVLAGLWSAGVNWEDFYAVHFSGGTTEVLSVKMGAQIAIRELGGSEDLHAGQFIDRVGVALGLPFPAGPKLEMLGRQAGGNVLNVPVAVKGAKLSFSGPESHVQRSLLQGATPASVARGVEHCVVESLQRILKNIIKENGHKPVLFVGGVMANHYIRERLGVRFGEHCAFAGEVFAGDNAVGAALFAQIFTN
jgi:N6-L-threonylcarbamoyladenine synthase